MTTSVLRYRSRMLSVHSTVVRWVYRFESPPVTVRSPPAMRSLATATVPPSEAESRMTGTPASLSTVESPSEVMWMRS